MVEVERTDANHPAFVDLVDRLDRYLAEINGSAHAFFAGHNRVADDTCIVLAKVDGDYAGCGGFRRRDNGTVEIKRMFVRPECRRQGVGAAILGELEAWAGETGHASAVLETSRRLTAAVKLYERSGYSLIPNYPPYEDVADSVCMEKALKLPAP